LVAQDVKEPEPDRWVFEKAPPANVDVESFRAKVEAAFVKHAVQPFVRVAKGLSSGKAFCEWMAELPLMDRMAIGSSKARLQATKTMWSSRAGVKKVAPRAIPEKRAGARRVIPSEQKKKKHSQLRERLVVAEAYHAWLKARMQEGSEPPTCTRLTFVFENTPVHSPQYLNRAR